MQCSQSWLQRMQWQGLPPGVRPRNRVHTCGRECATCKARQRAGLSADGSQRLHEMGGCDAIAETQMWESRAARAPEEASKPFQFRSIALPQPPLRLRARPPAELCPEAKLGQRRRVQRHRGSQCGSLLAWRGMSWEEAEEEARLAAKAIAEDLIKRGNMK
ncbi:unnamed protein product, partial [Polarella glacialis]